MDMTLNEFKYLTSTCWNEKYQPLTIDMTKDKYTGLYRLGLNSVFVPDSTPFQINKMSFYSKVTEQDSIILRNSAEQQKNQRAPKIKNRILRKTHDVKLAESLSSIFKKIEEANKSTKYLGEVFGKTNSETENNQDTVPVEVECVKIQSDIRALPSSKNFSSNMMETSGALMNSKKYF